MPFAIAWPNDFIAAFFYHKLHTFQIERSPGGGHVFGC